MHISRIDFDRSPVSNRPASPGSALFPGVLLAGLVVMLFVAMAFGMSTPEGQAAYAQVELME